MKRAILVLAILVLFSVCPTRAQADIIVYAWSGYNQPTGQFGTLDVQTGVFTQTGTLPGGIAGGDMARLPGGALYGYDSNRSRVGIARNRPFGYDRGRHGRSTDTTT